MTAADVDLPDLEDTSDFLPCLAAFRPVPRQRTIRWAIRHIYNDQGRPYDHTSYPHLGAPGGPMDAIDDPGVRTIAMQFATRLGKSFTGQVLILRSAVLDPCPMMIASESESALKRIMQRTYKMIYHQRVLRDAMLYRSPRDHKVDHMQFKACDCRGAWARSPGTLADATIKVGMANEIDKDGWGGKSTSNEADPLKLFDERFKDFQSIRKIIYESTPTIRGTSRIESIRLRGSNCAYWVPCPQCGVYQVLRLHDRESPDAPGRLLWDALPSGADPDHARRTARYQCVSGCECLDEHRPWMLRRGVWAPEGCGVDNGKAMAAAERWAASLDEDSPDDDDWVWHGWDRADWLIGQPLRDGPAASFKLSSFNALSLGWGDLAAEFVASKDSPRQLQNWANSWLADTWERRQEVMTWEQLGERMIRDFAPDVAPDACSFVTVGIDKQEIEPPYPWVAVAWGPEWWGHIIAYGYANTTGDVRAILESKWLAEDGESHISARALIDSGYKPQGVADFVRAARREKINVLPCKGSSQRMDSLYKISKQGKQSAMPGMPLVRVDTYESQDWLEAAILADAVPQLTVYRDSIYNHRELIEQLQNDYLDPDSNTWGKRDESLPNDWRDCVRYAYVAARMFARGPRVPVRAKYREAEQSTATAKPAAKQKTKAKARKKPDARTVWL